MGEQILCGGWSCPLRDAYLVEFMAEHHDISGEACELFVWVLDADQRFELSEGTVLSGRGRFETSFQLFEDVLDSAAGGRWPVAERVGVREPPELFAFDDVRPVREDPRPPGRSTRHATRL